ncbi:unnamed protein product [Sphagnum jensenii]|uniref:Dephospho-CoA kinase n=1 Tax=Sphagnum jensenii TaxID=128206 RepID=A0ABP0VAX8_9BRYO
MQLIGLAGPVAVGKTTVAQYLTAHHEFSEEFFAAKLKEIIAELCDYNFDELNGGEWREKPDSHYGKSPRQIMQEVGTAMRDIIHPNVWVDYLFLNKIYATSKNKVISDARFPNEQRTIIDAGGFIIILNRDGTAPAADAHVSETSYLTLKRTGPPEYAEKIFEVDNNGPIEETVAKIMEIAKNIYIKGSISEAN